MDAQSAWNALERPAQRAMELAWEAFQEGKRGIAAVLCDSAGGIAHEGRNRVDDDQAPEGHLFGSWIAHAEINALGALPPGNYRAWTLHTTLQPCVLCASAIAMSNVGTVKFLASDPLCRGVEGLPDIVTWLEKDWPRSIGPLGTPIAQFCSLLHLCVSFRQKPDGTLIRAYRESQSALTDFAGTLVTDGWQPDSKAHLMEELTRLWVPLTEIHDDKPLSLDSLPDETG